MERKQDKTEMFRRMSNIEHETWNIDCSTLDISYVHNSLLFVVIVIIVDANSRVDVPEDLSDGWNIDVLHGHREVRVRRTMDGCGDVGAEGRLLEIVFCLLAGV